MSKINKPSEQCKSHSLSINSDSESCRQGKLAFVDNRHSVQLQQSMIKAVQRQVIQQPLSREGYNDPESNATWETENIGGSEVGIEMTAYLAINHIAGDPPGSGALKEICSVLPTDPTLPNQYKYVKGHLLNDNVGGPGRGFNLFPITADANDKHESAIEATVKDWVNVKKQLVKYHVKVNHGGLQEFNPPIPSSKYIESTLTCTADILNPEDRSSSINHVSATIHSKYDATPQVTDINEDQNIYANQTYPELTPFLSSRVHEKSFEELWATLGPQERAEYTRVMQQSYYEIQRLLQIYKAIPKQPVTMDGLYTMAAKIMKSSGLLEYLSQPINDHEESNYYEIIKKPMNMSTIRRKYQTNMYSSLSEMEMDIILCLDNCILYHGPDSMLSNLAKHAKAMFIKKIR